VQPGAKLHPYAGVFDEPSRRLVVAKSDVGHGELRRIAAASNPESAAQGNGLIILAHQLIAAKLNIAHGADPADAAQAIADADAMTGSLAIPPIGSGYLPPTQISNLTETVIEYNEGTIGPGHCDD